MSSKVRHDVRLEMTSSKGISVKADQNEEAKIIAEERKELEEKIDDLMHFVLEITKADKDKKKKVKSNGGSKRGSSLKAKGELSKVKGNIKGTIHKH